MTDISPFHDLLQVCCKYFIIGVIQGLTEFIPISSTAHLKVVPLIMGWGDPGVSATAIIQLGSVLAVFTYFIKDLKEIIKGISLGIRHGQWKEENAQLGIAIILGTIPIILGGIAIKLFWKDFEYSNFRSIPSIGLISIFMAIVLAVAEKSGKRYRSIKNISGIQGLLIGAGQMFSLFPGVSRSGITLSTALFNGWERKDAARFSFLLGIPAITIAGLVGLHDALSQNINLGLIPILIGVISATISSWLSIEWLLKYLQRNNTFIFVLYRLLFGITLLAFWSKIPSPS